MSEAPQAPLHDSLVSVRELEQALEQNSERRAASEARVEDARAAALRLLAAARADAATEAEERRRIVLGAADADADEISRQGDERAARARMAARAGSAATVEALRLILPDAGTKEA